MNGEEHPHYTITTAFTESFDFVKTIWWQQVNDLNNLIFNEVTNGNYDAVFLQLQSDGIINEHAAAAISQHSIGFNWTGDVRTEIDWYARMGKYFVTCFTNMTDIEKMRALGLRAEYLQVGYDHNYYYPAPTPFKDNIVFCANNFDTSGYPLSGLRKEIAISLRNEFRHRFSLYGRNWLKFGIRADLEAADNMKEAEVYRACAIAINCSHFNYSRYSSDRLFREMACGAFVLSHKFKDYNIDFKEGKHLVTWDSIPDLINKCHYYLNHEKERKAIADKGREYAINNATWNVRMIEFKKLIDKYKHNGVS
jgi:hypothetical protein